MKFFVQVVPFSTKDHYSCVHNNTIRVLYEIHFVEFVPYSTKDHYHLLTITTSSFISCIILKDYDNYSISILSDHFHVFASTINSIINQLLLLYKKKSRYQILCTRATSQNYFLLNFFAVYVRISSVLCMSPSAS